MSEKPLEQQDIKKICLICGCHTNQAINIYEPRSGPNIIELIQAKFKFQPVNEDKFLCFSCNNWLINWHSLQVLNTKESDGNHASGKSCLNNSIPEEESENNMEMYETNNDKCDLYLAKSIKSFFNKPKSKLSSSYHSYLVRNSIKKRKSFYITKRFVSSWNKIRKTRRKSMQLCSLCGHASLKLQRSLDKCKNCRKILKWRATYYLKTMIEEEELKLKNKLQQFIKPDEAKTTEILQQYHKNLNLVTPMGSTRNQQQYFNQYQQNQQNNLRNQRPLVDGKVVAMLRRLGTTLTREGNEISSSTPIIMSPAKKKPQKPIWQKSNLNSNEEDDILIDFNTVISEVLPMVKVIGTIANNTELNNDITEYDENSDEVKPNLKEIYSKIPKCVTVSVINVAVS